MIYKIKRLIASDFLKQTLTLSAGTTVSQAIVIIISPVLSRLYTPSQLGVYSLFISSVNVFVQLSCLKYDMAVTAAKDEKDRSTLFYICLILSIITATLITLFFPFASSLSALFKADNSLWLYFLPLSTLFTGMFTALTNFNIKMNYYGDIAKANIIRSIVMAVIQVLFVVAFKNAIGLIIGQVLSYFAGNIKLIKNIYPILKKADKSFTVIANTAAKYNSYPKYTVVGSLANTGVFNIISYFLAYFYSTQQLGYYAMVNRVLGLPLAIISTAISQVYFSRVTQQKGNTANLFKNITILLTIISLPIFILLFLFAEPAVKVVFGSEWLESAKYIKILIPLFAIRFIVTPVSTAAIAKGRQMQTMLWQIVLLLISLLPVLINSIALISIETYLLLVSIGLSIGYLVFYIYCRGLIM